MTDLHDEDVKDATLKIQSVYRGYAVRKKGEDKSKVGG